MDNKIELIQTARTGKKKIMTIWTEKSLLKRSYGMEGGKLQYSEKEIEGKNLGKSNETTAKEQALVEMKALVLKKTKEGYQVKGEESADQKFTLKNLPSSFSPSKPINQPPAGVTFDGGYEDYYAERKYNGVNLWIVNDEEGTTSIYTRGAKNITHIIQEIPPIKEFIDKTDMPVKSFLSIEFIYSIAEKGIIKEVPKHLKGIINDRTTKEKAHARYDKLFIEGMFEIKCFDVLFWNGIDVTDKPYESRYKILFENVWDCGNYKPNGTFQNGGLNSSNIAYALKSGWEGFILRDKFSSKSTIEYTLNGKPYRRGAYKFKFEYEDDYVVTSVEYGRSGRLKGLPAKFELSKFDDKGELVVCTMAGPGNISTEQMEAFTEALQIDEKGDPGEVHIPLWTVVAVKFQSKQHESNALEFPVILDWRIDKPIAECLLSDIPKLYKKEA